MRLLLGLLAAACTHAPSPAPGPAAPYPAGIVLRVPGAPEGCTAAYVWDAAPPPPEGAGEHFRQLFGSLQGPDWGACVWMGPVEGSPAGRWVVMVWRPAWRGLASCWLEGRSSPLLLLDEPGTPIPPGVKAKWYAAQEGLERRADGRLPVPSSRAPCPAGQPGGAG